jgi:ABC-type Zn uptake system ZnuABC Zn-binding protein ZnuA
MNTPRKVIGVALLSLFAAGMALGLPGCGSNTNPWEGQPGPPRVVVSFPPLYCFVKNVAGDDAGVLCLCTNPGPHDYQYNSRDILKLRQADLFLTNGLNLDDDFTGKLKNSCGNLKLKTVELGEQAIPEEQLRKFDDTAKKDDHGHQHGAFDPHVWLGLPEAILMVERIRDELKEVDPKRANQYDQRAKDYIARLEELKAKGQKAFEGKKNRNLIASHDSLYYFARPFNLVVLENISPRPGVAADSAKITELVKLCKEKQVRVIAIEPQYPSAEAELLKTELHKRGADDTVIVSVDPLETATLDDLKDPQWYEKKMAENIDKLAEALR